MDAGESDQSAVGDTLGEHARPCSHVEIDPAEAGFDPQRLARIDRHYQRYVDEGKLPGFLARDRARRRGRARRARAGCATSRPACRSTDDTLWRIYSMTKPITSVAAMMLWEEGAFELKDPVARFIPAFADARVWAGGSQNKPVTVPATEPVRMWHLLTHTAGLTYGFHYARPARRRSTATTASSSARRRAWTSRPCTDAWAALPLLFEPGTEFNYSVATDVLGRVIEVLSGQPLDAFFKERILDPLGMNDTAFGAADPDRLAALYGPGLVRNDRMGAAALQHARVPLRRRRAGLHRRRLPPLHEHAARASWTARRCSGPVRCASWPATTCPAAPS